ncbi:phosphoglycerate dehydrogenase [Baekduia sp. Peel2402]|uniref:phosphoglycerate dehydrogenase n=1 Tax=Baekduia sp. Peel2402 TaxID=3458296 RepID=UPI00403EF150
MSAARVLVTCKQMQNVFETFRPRFEAADVEAVLPEIARQQLSEDELIALIGDFDGIIAGDDPLSARVLEHAPRLKTIAKWGVGTDAIDFDAAAAHGITVTNTPGVFGEDVADAALGYLLSLTRHITKIHMAIVDGDWLKIEGTRLAGKTAGVLGYGSIGKAVARRLVAFGCDTLAYDAVPAALEGSSGHGVAGVGLDELLSRSEVLVLCAPLTPDTHHIIDAATLAQLPDGALFVNVSRGPLVDEPALVEALRSGKITAAALDVFEDEPLAADNPLRSFEQCVFGSHNGSNTAEGVLQCSAQAVENLLRELRLS